MSDFDNDSIDIEIGLDRIEAELERLRDIEQKAIALLRDLETSMEPNSPVRLLNSRFEDLGKAIGITIEDLRGEQ